MERHSTVAAFAVRPPPPPLKAAVKLLLSQQTTRRTGSASSSSCLFQQSSPASASDPPDDDWVVSGGVRFLGKGPRAIVRPGSVLVAPQHEFHHYYRQAAIFVYDMGEDDEGVYVIRGLILDHPTPFTLQEMIPGKFDNSPLGETLLFRGGDKGGDGVVLLHNRPELGQVEIGGSGIYQGGWDAAVAAIEAKQSDVDEFKAFFNFCEFSEDELEDLLESTEDGDSWASVEVGTDIVLSDQWDRGDCWKRLRNAVSQQMQA